jgi:MFS family permease
MMTVMAGATIAPSLPQMKAAFPDNPSAETLVKLILTIPGLFIAATAPFSGWIIDRFGRIRLLVIALFVYAAAGTSGLYLNTLMEIIVGRAFLGIAVGGIMTTAVALIGDYFDGPERQSFLGVQASIMALSGTLFITVGGTLADVGWRYPFLIYGMAILAIPLVLIFLKEPPKAEVTEAEKKQPKAKIPSLAWTIYILSFLGMAVFYMMPVQVPFLIQEVDNVGGQQVGLALGTVMLVGGMVSFNFKRIKNRLTHYQIYGISFLTLGLGYGMLYYASSYATLFPGLIMAGIGSGLIMPNSNLCLVSLAPPNVRGRVLGLLTTFIFLGQFLSPIMFQPVVNISSISHGFFYLAIALVFFSVISLIRNRRLIKQPV